MHLEGILGLLMHLLPRCILWGHFGAVGASALAMQFSSSSKLITIFIAVAAPAPPPPKQVARPASPASSVVSGPTLSRPSSSRSADRPN